MPIAFRKVLLPVDLGAERGTAIQHAADIASAASGEVLLLHVVELIPGIPVEEDPEFYERLEATAREHLQALGTHLQERGCRFRTTVRTGNRVAEILAHARESEADLIVLRSHRIDLENPSAGWGTLSYKVGILSQCPVLLVK